MSGDNHNQPVRRMSDDEARMFVAPPAQETWTEVSGPNHNQADMRSTQRMDSLAYPWRTVPRNPAFDPDHPTVRWGEVCPGCLCLILSSGLHADGCSFGGEVSS